MTQVGTGLDLRPHSLMRFLFQGGLPQQSYPSAVSLGPSAGLRPGQPQDGTRELVCWTHEGSFEFQLSVPLNPTQTLSPSLVGILLLDGLSGWRSWLNGRDTREQTESMRLQWARRLPCTGGGVGGVCLGVCVSVCLCLWLPASQQDPPNPGARQWRPLPLNFFTVNKAVGLVDL